MIIVKHLVRIRMKGHRFNGRTGILKSIAGPDAIVTIAECVHAQVPYSALEDLA